MENVEKFFLINKKINNQDLNLISEKSLSKKGLIITNRDRNVMQETAQTLNLALDFQIKYSNYMEAELGEIQNHNYFGFRMLSEIKDNVQVLILVCNSIVISAMIEHIRARRGLSINILGTIVPNGKTYMIDLSNPKEPKFGLM